MCREGFVSQITALRDGVDHYIYVRILRGYDEKPLLEADWAPWGERGEVIDVDIRWRGARCGHVLGHHGGARFMAHRFHHLFAGDQRIAQADIGGVDVGSWRVGDVCS